MTYIKTRLKKDISIDSIITIHYFEYLKNFIFRGESHDFWEFLYVDNGEVSVRADDEVFTLNTGDIIFHRPNEFHAFKSIGKNAPNLVAVSFSSNSLALREFHKFRTTLSMKERSMISDIISEAHCAFSTPLYDPAIEQVMLNPSAPFGSCQMILLHLEEFLITLKRNHLSEVKKETTSDHAPLIETPANITTKVTQFEEITAYMHEHICDHLTIPIICNEFSISRSSLQSLFNAQKECGTIEYFNQIKIEYAKEIIRSGTMNFTEIAHYLSYSSLQYFSKQFKKATGMSPLAYSSSVKAMSNAFIKNE